VRRILVMLALIGALGVPAAAQDAALPYALTFSGTPGQGTIRGAWGGMPVDGAYADGRWVLVSSGRPLIAGTYRCDSGCTFEGAAVYEGVTTFRLHVPGLQDTPVAAVSGSISVNLTPATLR
jgi:hypothetical protein